MNYQNDYINKEILLMSKRSTQNEFIKKSKDIYGDLYLYNNTKYINKRTKVEIQCRRHGKFWVYPLDHINRKTGCGKCYLEILREKFLQKSFRVHKNTYMYDFVNYQGSQTPVLIICKIHNGFYQTPDAHISGSGCPRCSNSKGYSEITN